MLIAIHGDKNSNDVNESYMRVAKLHEVAIVRVGLRVIFVPHLVREETHSLY